jgi:glutamate racemase
VAHIDTSPVGVFDSGVGGLTVLRALQRALPAENFIYLGDTARLPYGTKSPRTVERYAVQAARVLVERGIKALVVACNTASAVALRRLREAYAPLPVFGVVEPGAIAAAAASRSGCIAVAATESTIRGGAYQRAILTCRPDARVVARPCPLLVTLAEEGWVDGAVPRAVLDAYLGAWLHPHGAAWQPDCLVLGCTHFPVLRTLLAEVAGPEIAIVDSADTTAAVVRAALCRCRELPLPASAGACMLLATDDQARFARVGQVFLGAPISASEVELVDL